MFGGNWRLLRSVVALSLPTVVVVALGVFFFVDKVPEIEKAERNRVKLEYRETALAMRQNPDGAEYHVEKTLLTEWRGIRRLGYAMSATPLPAVSPRI